MMSEKRLSPRGLAKRRSNQAALRRSRWLYKGVMVSLNRSELINNNIRSNRYQLDSSVHKHLNVTYKIFVKMRAPGSILLPFFGLLSLASATCYTSGAPWPSDHAGTDDAIQKAADHFASLSPLPVGEAVYDIGVGDKCLHFILDNISGQPRSIDANEAKDGFLKEYRGCENGGDTSYTNWRYV